MVAVISHSDGDLLGFANDLFILPPIGWRLHGSQCVPRVVAKSGPDTYVASGWAFCGGFHEYHRRLAPLKNFGTKAQNMREKKNFSAT
jgi:hypothetical protein